MAPAVFGVFFAHWECAQLNCNCTFQQSEKSRAQHFAAFRGSCEPSLTFTLIAASALR
jgi:hypothetical protein